jgi:S-DNA-T family DNA segregation ATPase FtsK/SpoIIIE
VDNFSDAAVSLRTVGFVLITVTARAPCRELDLEVGCPPETPLVELNAALCAELGVPAQPLLVDGQQPPVGATVGSVLRHGSVLCVGPPAPTADPARSTLHVVGGQGAGRQWRLPPGTHLVGRAPEHPVRLDFDLVSRTHAELRVSDADCTLVDRGSTNGVWRAAERVSATPLPAGEPIRVGGTVLAMPSPPAGALVAEEVEGRLLVNRAPRVHPAVAAPRLVMPSPPAERPAPRLPWLAMLGPLVMGLALAFLMDPRFLLFSLLSPVMAGGQALSDRWHHKREVASTAAAHAEAVARVSRRVADAQVLETRARRTALPDPAAVLTIVGGPTSRLWERRPGDEDWLRLRVGLATLPSEVQVEGDLDVPALHDVPLCVSLREHPVVGVAGAAALRRRVGEWLVGQTAALHSPLDLRIAVLAAERSSWAWTRWLPHSILAASAGDLIEAVHRDGAPTLVVIDGARAHRGSPGLTELLRDPGRHAVVCLEDHVADLPPECAAVVDVSASPMPALRLRANGRAAVTDALPDLVDADWGEQLARRLAPLVDVTRVGGAQALPTDVRWDFDPGRLLEQWQTPSTKVVLGRTADGPWELDLTVDGPHALIAGTTGSGKSEALRTLVAALAAANPPEALSFVLVDYKGGAAFGPCADLPHVAGLVTDLDSALTERALQSLGAELRRRERLLRASGVDDLRDYPLDAAEPLARLVIVVDEFATLAEELPDFVGGLVAIAQRGRSLGVHLVLATQRPEGCVSADIRANTSLRLCLAVARDTESRDVVDAPDAAAIPPGFPGRGYARVGSGPLQAVHVARATAPPIATAQGWVRRADAVREALTGPSPLEQLVAATCELTGRGAATSARSPWLPPLPHPISTGAAVWAVADLPEEQRRGEERFDLDADGHLLILGAPRSGRTTAARALVLSATTQLSADELHVYAVDDSGALDDLAELPHCGAVVRVHDVDRLARLIALLTTEVRRRRERPVQGDPHLLLVVDRWETVCDVLEGRDQGRWAEELQSLVVDGAAVGLHVVAVFGGRMPTSRLAAAIERKLVLRLADPSDFAMFGVPLRCVPTDLPSGRGFLVTSGRTRLVQVTHPGPVPRAAEPRLHAPRRVDALPGCIDTAAAERLRRKPRPEGQACVLLGVGGDELTAVDVDLVSVGPAFVVAGPPRSGRSTALRRLVLGLLAERVPVALVLPRSSPLAELPGVVLLDEAATLPEGHVVVCDDAELADPWALALLQSTLRAARDGGPPVLLAGTAEDLAAGFHGPIAEARRSRCGLVLSPRVPHDGELLGVRLPQPAAGEPPPGRGALVLRGTVTTVQVAV